jgi:hypothetical protein
MASVAVFSTGSAPTCPRQAGREVKHERRAGARPLVRAPEQAEGESRASASTPYGGGLNLVALFIVITTAATLNAKG